MINTKVLYSFVLLQKCYSEYFRYRFLFTKVGIFLQEEIQKQDYGPYEFVLVLHGYCQVLSKSHSVVSNSLQPHGPYSPWNSPGQTTGVGSLFLLQGIFATLEWSLDLRHCRLILYQLISKPRPNYVEFHTQWLHELINTQME